ncbi:MAG: hypothetical protein H6806_00195 [Planctomycetes bacterium]|nr:hypothetical protein [Planctomycetota bacterium]MCB9901488.1 hypothetical protein [Planctomycetota bacterium]
MFWTGLFGWLRTVTCPHCGRRQAAPRRATSIVCRGCHKPFTPPVATPRPRPNPRPKPRSRDD